MANDLEGVLKSLVNQIATTLAVRRCSYGKYRDFKVAFGSRHADRDSHTFFVEFRLDEQTIKAWAGGLGYHFPEDVKTFMREKFPHASYRKVRSEGVDGFHYWSNVTQQELLDASKP